MKSPSAYNGLVVVNKPAGITSHDVVNRARRIFGTKRVGHTGTLDPDAVGVLVLCIGNATRVAEWLTAHNKNYEARFLFGVTTDSQDMSGTVLTNRDASALTEAAIRSELPRFTGDILQVPPMVSALKRDGKKLCDLARAGITVERAPRPVHIAALDLNSFTPGPRAQADLTITCSTGTYIRTLAFDLGEALGYGGAMLFLRRCWVGDDTFRFTLEDARTLEELEALGSSGKLGLAVKPLREILAGWPTARIAAEGIPVVARGQVFSAEEPFLLGINNGAADRPLVILNPQDEVIALAAFSDGQIQPHKVFISQ